MYGARNWGRIGWGLLLVLVGAFLLTDRIVGLPLWFAHYRWWALLVIGIGTISLIRLRDAKDVGTGVFFILMGAWFLLVSNGQFGLTWHNSWPLALVAIGASTIARAIAARWLPDRRFVIDKEQSHA